MRKIILIGLTIIGGYFIYNHFKLHKKVSEFFAPEITISDLKSRPSVFADSLVELKNLRVIETQAVMNYSKSIVTDESGQKIILLSSRPFHKNEIINVTGRYTVVYQNKDRNCEVFISDDLRPLSDLIKVIKHAIIF